MLNELISRYKLLDENSVKVVNLLSLTCDPMGIDEIIRFFPGISQRRVETILRSAIVFQLIIRDNYNYSKYIANPLIMIWLFPVISSINVQFHKRKDLLKYNTYTPYNYEWMLNYLNAMCHYPAGMKVAEEKLLFHDKDKIHLFAAIFSQPAYDPYIHLISDNVLTAIYSNIMSETIYKLNPLDQLQQIDSKTSDKTSLNLLRTEIAIMHGNFEQAREYASIDRNESLYYFVEAIFAFINNDIDDSLLLFKQGLKKQRRLYKNKYIPVLPEVAIFYLSACLSKEQDYYMPIFRKMAEEKGSMPSIVYKYFHNACIYCIENVENSEKIAISLKQFDSRDVGPILWKMIAVGLTDQTLTMGEYVARSVKQAFKNGYYVAAYESSYLLMQWFPCAEYKQLFEDVSTHLNYIPALSHIKHPDEWEKQLNSFFALEAVRMVVQKEADNGKTRVAYRFFPETAEATPILQTHNTNGIWSFGRNIAMHTFIDAKIDTMTEQDRRIAACGVQYSSMLRKSAIFEMTGHPLVFLKDSNILIELIVAQPVINVVKSADNNYTMECDISNPQEGIIVEKETNTRYKVYNLTKFQCDILKAVSKSKPVPEQGYEKLMQILKHFSMYTQVHSDLTVGGDDDERLQQVDTDSRIRVQLLPMGDGFRAELFVKPFGSHPPYCKPGRGGKVLIATENGERVRVIRDMDTENTYSARIYNDIQSIENIRTSDDGMMTFNNPLDSLELLDILDNYHDISVVEWPEGERLRIRKRVTTGDFSLKVKSNVNWFELEGELKVDEDTILTISTLLEMTRNGYGRFIELSKGEFLVLSDQLRQRLSELSACTSESKDGVAINRFASASMMDMFDEFENFSADMAWIDFRRRLQTVQLSNASVPSLLQAELRPYQVSAYQWMIRLSEWGAGACLADDMGLGKTVQAIAVMLYRAHIGATLVVSPVSVMPNWISEVTRFAPSLNVKILHNADRMTTIDSLGAGDLLVTSYGLLLSEEKMITSKHWATVILDEAHAIKNYNTKTSKAAMSLQADFRVILTGTPIQNHLGEVWNLFQFINPGLLGSLSHFANTFVRPEDEKARNRLKKLITPFILRRTKASVLEELPPKTEIIRKITLSDEETTFYETLRRKAVESLENDEKSLYGVHHLKVLAEITRLRQACCSPSLVYPGAAIESTKLATFLEIASELKENGHRALVFSQFVAHLSIVRNALDKAGYTYCYLDGATSMGRRGLEVNGFQNGRGDFFLISLKAGGLGLNLTAADYVIHLDPWWNPAIEDQASDRAYRIGQSRPVTVYRLVAEHTIEEKIIQLHNTKRDLADSLLAGSDKSAKMSISELMSLIREK